MASGKVLIALSIAALAFMRFFTYRNATLTFFSENKSSTLDSDCSYNSETAYELIRRLDVPCGKPGAWICREFYAWTEITADLVFPIIYSLLLSLLIIYIFQKFANSESWQTLAMLPLIAMLFDYCENVLIAFMLFAYPTKYLVVASVASVLTKLKLSFIVVSGAAILFGLVCLATKSLNRGSKAH
jgi:hypothetical protein